MQGSKFGEHLYLTPRVPQGLAAAVEGLTREVIRHRPENIYAFAARHFENLLRLREQYDDPSSSSKAKSKKQLHQVNEAIRARKDDESKDNTIDHARQSGWSLNETAKVLEKHRSIFGDSGQKVSTEQIRELANEPILTVRERLQDGSPKRRVNRSNEENVKCTPGSSRRKECSTQEASKNGAARNAPKILSQIPIAKDIKTELKRNRISSRERKKVVACEYTRETIVEKSSKKSSFEKTRRSYSEVRKSSRTEDSSSSTKKRTETSTKSRTNAQEDKKFTRGGSMDSVKNYVVQNFVSMTSLNELQSPSYVEKVQEVIDETSSVIKEKVEALKSGVAKAAKTKQMKKEASMSSEDHSKSSNSDKREPNLFRRNSKILQESTNKASLDQDVSEASESKSSLPAVRPLSAKSTSRSISARSDSEAALTLPPISPESAKSPKVKEELVLPVLSPPRTAPSVDEPVSADDTTAAVDEIAEDATVSSEKIIADKVVKETVSVGEVVKQDSMPSDGSLMQLEETAVDESVTEEHAVHAEEKIDENKTEVVAEKIVPEVSEEKLVPPEENDDEKAVPSTDSKDEKAAPSPDSKDEKSVPPEEIDGEKEVPLEETNDEKVVPLEETNDEKVSPKEIDDEKSVPPKESDDEKTVPPKENESEKAVPPVDAQSEKEVTEEKPTVVEQTIEEKVLSTETITNETVQEIIISEKQATSDHQITDKSATHLLEVKEEEFHDSLNVTPEPFDTKGQRPDSLENSLVEDSNSSGHVSPIETLKDKLLEIEEVQKRIEDVLDDTKTSKTDEATTTTTTTTTTTGAKIEDKLIEIQESEKRIEQILNLQSPSETLNSDIKNKLQELEEAERRIESIFPKEITKESSEKTDMLAVEIIEESVVITTEKESKEERLETSVTTTELLNVPIVETTIIEPSTRAVSPHSYILTEGSPYEIPDSVTTVIIPERTTTPDSETLRVEVEDGKILSSTLVTSTKESEETTSDKINDAFGEPVETSEQSEPSTVDIEYIRGIKASHDMIVSRENLDRIKEEGDEATTTTATTAEVIDSEDEKVLKVVTSSLEEILEREEVEYVQVQQITNKFIEEEKQQEIVENSLESTTGRSVEESTNEVKETSVTTDRSSLSLDPIAPNVPELNLDSLPDLTISSFNINSTTSDLTDNEKALTKKEEENSLLDTADSEAETQEFEKLEARLTQQPTAASDIGVPEGEEEEEEAARDINNIVCSAKDSENNLTEATASAAAAAVAESQCTIVTTGLIDTNKSESMVADHDENDDDDNAHADEKKAYHIYVPEANSSKDVSSSSETSTFMSAATKIQAGVRGFLTRRRLQSTQKRSSTLDSVPSIQESFTVETTPALMPIVESTTSISDAKARKKLRREDAVQRTTLSVENAFAENQLQHTGEFHDGIPLPVFDAEALSLKSVKERDESDKSKQKANQVEQLLEKILLGHAASNFAARSKLVDVVLLPADADIQNKYLNFITSVEDVFSDLPETPKGVIIEEITSLDESNNKSVSDGDVKKTERIDDDKQVISTTNDGEETLASISTSEDPLSINIEEVLGLGGEEDEASRLKSNRLNVKLNTVDQLLLRSSSVSQDSPISDERTRSPVTMMMQIGPNKSVDEKSEENPT